jgi:hypothetical protein
MSAVPAAEREIESYLRRLRASLRGLPVEQVEDIVREIRSHLLDSAGSDGEQLTDALARLGDPEVLGGAYRMDDLALRAQTSRSPLLLLRFVMHWATRSLGGLGALVVAFLGYGTALVAFGCALFKPFMPDRVGLWVRRVPPDDWWFQLGRVPAAPTDAREVLGWYIVPLGLLLGTIALTATSRYLLAKVRKLRPARNPSAVAARDRP